MTIENRQYLSTGKKVLEDLGGNRSGPTDHLARLDEVVDPWLSWGSSPQHSANLAVGAEGVAEGIRGKDMKEATQDFGEVAAQRRTIAQRFPLAS